jgi:hypothetical protein
VCRTETNIPSRRYVGQFELRRIEGLGEMGGMVEATWSHQALMG